MIKTPIAMYWTAYEGAVFTDVDGDDVDEEDLVDEFNTLAAHVQELKEEKTAMGIRLGDILIERDEDAGEIERMREIIRSQKDEIIHAHGLGERDLANDFEPCI